MIRILRIEIVTVTMINIALAVVALFLMAEAKSIGDPAERIVGGQNAREGQFPHQVSLRRFNGTVATHFCGGVIISDHFVLTSADSVRRPLLRPADVTIVAGTRLLTLGRGTTYNVSRITSHPQFILSTIIHDISVLRTTQRIVFTNLVRAIRLPTANPPNNAQTTYAGWGMVRVRAISFFLMNSQN